MTGFSDTLEQTGADTREMVDEPGDHDKFAHFVEKQAILEATINGTPVTALCGHTWVPTRAPDKFPTCPACQEAFDALPKD